MSLREYVVTLHRREDLDSFYRDMENEGGPLFIPFRPIPVHDRQPTSRNTTYLLSDNEANRVSRDPRVASVELSFQERGIEIRPAYSQTSTAWVKNSTNNNTHKNWGILRCVEGRTRSGWGSNGTTTVSGTVNVTASGKNVDVVIVDGHINPAHPEFAVNANGTGGSRVVQFNWFSLNPLVTGGAAGTYNYTPYVDPTYPDNDGDGYSDRTVDNDHGAHVAGTAVGNDKGWARDANIYNINPYGSGPSYSNYFLQYIRVWHQTKAINPITGIKNPTITNHSYGIETGVLISTITSVRYQGTIYTGPFTGAQLQGYGIYNNGTTAAAPLRSSFFEADFQDMIDAGVIVVGAAGNTYTKIANTSANPNDDYNNYFATSSNTYYYMRGTITAASNIVCVGGVDAVVAETKLTFSNCGPRIDLYAPGRFIISSVNSNIFGTGVTDSRNASYIITKFSGTSMASPQVCGVVACLAEAWPTLKQADVVTHLQRVSTTSQITDTGGGTTDFTALQGSNNRYLYFFKKRPDVGQVGPVFNYGNRPTSGQTYPRSKIFRYGR